MDDLDRASEREQIARDAAIARAQRDMPQGKPGECDWCEQYSPRLVGGACARCRDERKLK